MSCVCCARVGRGFGACPPVATSHCSHFFCCLCRSQGVSAHFQCQGMSRIERFAPRASRAHVSGERLEGNLGGNCEFQSSTSVQELKSTDVKSLSVALLSGDATFFHWPLETESRRFRAAGCKRQTDSHVQLLSCSSQLSAVPRRSF